MCIHTIYIRYIYILYRDLTSQAVSGLTQIAKNKPSNNNNNKRETDWNRPHCGDAPKIDVCVCLMCVVQLSLQCEIVCMALGLGLWHNPQQQSDLYQVTLNLVSPNWQLPTGNWFIWVKKKFNSFNNAHCDAMRRWCDLNAAYRISYGMPCQITVPGIS